MLKTQISANSIARNPMTCGVVAWMLAADTSEMKIEAQNSVATSVHFMILWTTSRST